MNHEATLERLRARLLNLGFTSLEGESLADFVERGVQSLLEEIRCLRADRDYAERFWLGLPE